MNAPLESIEHIVVLMLENRSFDHMLGVLYADQGNRSPGGQPFEGLTGNETNPDGAGHNVTVFKIATTDQNAYFMSGADPGEGYVATNMQLFGMSSPTSTQTPDNAGFVQDFAQTLQWEGTEDWSILPGTIASNIMGMFTPQMLPVLCDE